MMALICLDTNVVIWGILKECRNGEEIKLERAKSLIAQLAQSKDNILLPSIVVAETLAGVDNNYVNDANDFFHKHFMVIPFDMAAAKHYARLLQTKRPHFYNPQKKMWDIPRREYNADCAIVATAISRKVDIIYSEDAHLTKIALGEPISVKTLPPVPPALLNLPMVELQTGNNESKVLPFKR